MMTMRLRSHTIAENRQPLKLPRELFYNIIIYLPQADRLTMSLTCRKIKAMVSCITTEWKLHRKATQRSVRYLVKHFKNIKYLNMKSCYKIKDDAIKLLGNLEKLTKLDISYCNIGNNLKALVKLKNLKELRTSVASSDILLFTQLEILYLIEVPQVQFPISHLALFPNLKSLNFTSYGDSIEGLSAVTQITHLEYLCSKSSFTSAAASQIAQLKNLSSLNLSLNMHFVDSHMLQLRTLNRLKVLDFHGCFFITDQAIKNIVSSPNMSCLEKLIINGCVDVTDESISKLINLTKLIYLNVKETKVTKSCIEDLIKAFSKIRKTTDSYDNGSSGVGDNKGKITILSDFDSANNENEDDSDDDSDSDFDLSLHQNLRWQSDTSDDDEDYDIFDVDELSDNEHFV